MLTLGPLFALEGQCQIYPEFSAGPFVYRVAHLMTAEELALARARQLEPPFVVGRREFSPALDTHPCIGDGNPVGEHATPDDGSRGSAGWTGSPSIGTRSFSEGIRDGLPLDA